MLRYVHVSYFGRNKNKNNPNEVPKNMSNDIMVRVQVPLLEHTSFHDSYVQMYTPISCPQQGASLQVNEEVWLTLDGITWNPN